MPSPSTFPWLPSFALSLPSPLRGKKREGLAKGLVAGSHPFALSLPSPLRGKKREGLAKGLLSRGKGKGTGVIRETT
jgi:hypothetical protein